MEPKKSKKADLERNISIYFGLGLVIALSLSLIAFEWMTEAKSSSFFDFATGEQIDTELFPPSTETPEKKVVIPLAPPEVFEIIDDKLKPIAPVNIGSDIIREDDTFEIYIPIIKDEPDEPEDFYMIQGEKPKFGDGDLNDFTIWVQRRIKYPAVAVENNIQGKVYIQFVVEKDGTLSNLQILKGRDSSLDDEALRVLGLSPLWTPGTNNGIPARVRCTIMINFVLQR